MGETVTIEEYQDHCPDKAVLLDISTGNMPAFVSPASADWTGRGESEIDDKAASPGTIPIAVPEHDDEPVDAIEPVFDPLLTTAGNADDPTGPLNLPSTIGLSGPDRPDQANGPAPAQPMGLPAWSKLLGEMGLAFACPGAVLGDYELIDMLAQGGMGVVFKARQIKLNRIVALKTIKSGTLAEARELRLFQSEAEAVAALDHPNIVPILEVGEQGGLHYYSMKLIEGWTVQDSLARFKDQPAAIARLVEQVAGAIHHAHQRGVLHRDLKPSNILVDAQGNASRDRFRTGQAAGNTDSDSTTRSGGGRHAQLHGARAGRRPAGGDHHGHRRLWPGHDSLRLAHGATAVPCATSITRRHCGRWSIKSRSARARSTPRSIATSRQSA